MSKSQDTADKQEQNENLAWRILSVDDDPDIQLITAALLEGFRFEGRPVELLQADSASQARQSLEQHADIALVLLDVAMESNSAGLQLAQEIRVGLNNPFIRIILRTARQDQAPARETVESYEIDAYFDKANADYEQLLTQISAALRTYRNLLTLNQQRLDLEQVLHEREQMEMQLRQAQKLQAVGQLAAGIAHEINTPIQFVSDNCTFVKQGIEDLQTLRGTQESLFRLALSGQGESQHLQDQWQAAAAQADAAFLDDELPQAMQRSLAGLQRMADIIKAMNEFAHPGQKEASLADINQVIRSTLTVAGKSLSEAADVVTDLGDLPAIECFPGALGQALLNIVMNAAQAMRAMPKRGQLSLRSCFDQEHIHIEISDTGPGIPEADRERLFEPFFTTKAVGEGSGQGLAIAYNVIVQQHRGSLELLDAEQGARFRVQLPVNAKSLAADIAS